MLEHVDSFSIFRLLITFNLKINYLVLQKATFRELLSEIRALKYKNHLFNEL